MLEKAAAAVKADKSKARSDSEGRRWIKDRDLYTFCANAGWFDHRPSSKGQDIKHKDKNSGIIKMMKRGRGQGRRGELHVPRPGADTTPCRRSFVTKAGDQVCGVGYAK